jgi:coenzyme PQQ biosynthesis protein PqqD
LARGCRISNASGQEATLLMPEAALKLNGPGLKILQSCDGQRTFTEIVQELQTVFSAQALEQIESDTAAFLERLQERRAIDYE